MDQSVIPINQFTGLNTRDAPGRIADTEMIECQNFDLGRHGELIKRSGIKTLATISAGKAVTIIGLFQTVTVNQIIVRVGNDLYWTSDGTAFTLIGTWNNIEYGVQYVDKFYMVRRDDVMVQWDGAAASSIAGSPFGSFCMVFKDRMFVVNSYSTTVANRVYYSQVAGTGGTTFQTANWVGLSLFFDVSPGDGDVVVAFSVLHGNFFIFKQQSTWILYVTPDPTGWSLDNRNPKIGCMSKYAIREIEGWLYFVGPRGAYRTDGYTFDEISESVQSLFRGQVVATSAINQTVAAWWEDKLIIVVQTYVSPTTWGSLAAKTWNDISNQPWDSGNAIYTWLVYHLRTGQWTKWAPATAASISILNMLEVNGPATIKGLYMGSRILDGKIHRYGDTVYVDGAASSYDCVVETKDFDFGHASAAKRGMWVSVERQGAGQVSIYNIPDNNQQVPSVVVFADNNRKAQKVPGPGFFRVWRVRAVATHDGPVTFYGFDFTITARRKSLAGI